MGVLDVEDYTKVSFEAGRRILREWREDHARNSEQVVQLWEYVLSRSPSSLGDELCMVYEQVAIASLDNARYDLASDCIQALRKKFPNSHRVLKLEAMRFEALGQYSTANDLYDQLIKTEPTNNSYRKRKVSILLAQGHRMDAIKALNEYLKVFLNDTEAWLLLSELFLKESDLAKAAHCIEECLLTSPMNCEFVRRLADIKYSLGDQESLDMARIYYQQASKLNRKDLRALYGILLCCTHLCSSKVTSEKKKEYAKEGHDAATTLASLYAKAGNEEYGETVREMGSQLIKGI